MLHGDAVTMTVEMRSGLPDVVADALDAWMRREGVLDQTQPGDEVTEWIDAVAFGEGHVVVHLNDRKGGTWETIERVSTPPPRIVLEALLAMRVEDLVGGG